MRPGDLFGRLGGEEFACLLADVTMAQALHTAERLRREFAAMQFPGLEIGSDSISMKFTDGNRAVLQKESAPCESIFGFLLSSPWV